MLQALNLRRCIFQTPIHININDQHEHDTLIVNVTSTVVVSMVWSTWWIVQLIWYGLEERVA